MLPVFSGQESATCRWEGVRLSVEWGSLQKNIFESDPGHQISPELMRSVVAQLEKHQQELEHKNADLEARNEQLRKAYSELEDELKNKMTFTSAADAPMVSAIPNLDFIESSSIIELRSQISRLGDYMIRAQQLMTILIGNQRVAPQVVSALKKTNWEFVKTEFPKTMTTCFEILKQTQEINKAPKNINQEKTHV
jgi:predicted RNase H-like nuclease (RuvC/YqgF family)